MVALSPKIAPILSSFSELSKTYRGPTRLPALSELNSAAEVRGGLNVLLGEIYCMCYLDKTAVFRSYLIS